MSMKYISFLISFSLLGCESVESDTKLYYSSIDHTAVVYPHSKSETGIIEILETDTENISPYQRSLRLPGASLSVYKIVKVHEVSKSASVVSEDSFLKLVLDASGRPKGTAGAVTLFYDKHGVNFSCYGKKLQVGQKLALVFNAEGQLAWVEPIDGAVKSGRSNVP
jgi:hypothetical protein